MMKMSSNIHVLLFNVYMPCDTGHDLVNLDTYSDVLHKIDEVCTTHPAVDNIVIGGDFNTDITRVHSLHTGAFNDFFYRDSLVSCLSCNNTNICYTYENMATDSRSTIDHVVVSDSLRTCIGKYYSVVTEKIYRTILPL
jgi:hypothetical protein